ncbi:hypothetical protein DL95DRAFT_508833, partial [Leptodontidium sp. 2 PMI_412]
MSHSQPTHASSRNENVGLSRLNNKRERFHDSGEADMTTSSNSPGRDTSTHPVERAIAQDRKIAEIRHGRVPSRFKRTALLIPSPVSREKPLPEVPPPLPLRPSPPNVSLSEASYSSTSVTEFTNYQASTSSGSSSTSSPATSFEISIGYSPELAEEPRIDNNPLRNSLPSTNEHITQNRTLLPLPPLPLPSYSRRALPHQEFSKIYNHLDKIRDKHIFVAGPISPKEKRLEKIEVDFLQRSVDEIIQKVFLVKLVGWEILEVVEGEASFWWNRVKSDSHFSLEKHIYADMLAGMPLHVKHAAEGLWYDFWGEGRVPMAQVSLGAVSCLHALRHRSFLPRRIPPELRCRESRIQCQGWSLFQKSLPELDMTILIGRLQSIHGSDAVAFLELMLSTESLSKTITILDHLSTSRYFFHVQPSVLGNLFATLVVRLTPHMDNQEELGNALECLSQIINMATQNSIGDASSAIPEIFGNVLDRLDPCYNILCFGIFLCLANQWPDTSDVNQGKVLDSLRARIRHETRTRGGARGKKRIHTDFLISLRVVLTLERLHRKGELTPMFPIFYPDMDELVGEMFRDAWDVLGLRELYDN